MRWQTNTVPNGTYTLALVVIDSTGNEMPERARIVVTINN